MLVLPDDWRPQGVDDLEPGAWQALRETDRSVCVTAGAGAGKTEFLAQKAAYLLQTGICPPPKRILAISFKRDASQTLKARVGKRCPPDQARRFHSLTFDAFTKNMLDRFRAAIPHPLRPPANYEIGFPRRNDLEDFLTRHGRRDIGSQQLEAIGPRDGKPVPPLNLIGDFGGGGMFLAYGVVCGILEARSSGKGQVVDAAMVDGAATLMGFFRGLAAMGVWNDTRGDNMLDGGAHFYDAYETSDGRYVSVGSIEPQFYAELLEKTGLAGEDLPGQNSRSDWPMMKERLTAIFKTKTRDEWCEIMEGSDVCFAPVLSLTEAPQHPHNAARNTYVEIGGNVQPAPAPRFSRTVPETPAPAAHAGQHTDEALADWGFSPDELAKLRESKAIA